MEALQSHVRRVDAASALEELAQVAEPRMYLCDGDTVVASGCAARIVAEGPNRFQVARMRAKSLFEGATRKGRAPPGVGPRLMGGFGFEEGAVSGPWAPFGALSFWLPAKQLHYTSEGIFEVTNQISTEQTLDQEEPLGDETHTAEPESLDVAGWDDAVRQVLDAIEEGSVSKVVLSRSRKTAPTDPVSAVSALHRVEPDATQFLFGVKGATFFGATPERLVVRQSDSVQTHALAGTATAGEDAGEALRQSPKDILEHELVTTYIRGRLEGLGAKDVHQERRRIQALRNVQHLETPITGRTERHILELAEALHPTPAVCGLPPRASLAWIQQLEPSKRGWYTGAVGWFDANGHGRFHVALRCALATQEATWLHAGAGIVSDSNPRLEWEETEHKLRSIEAALAEVSA